MPPDYAPAALQGSLSFFRQLSVLYDDKVIVRWTPKRRCFTLWERTPPGDLVVIQDLPEDQALNRQVLDHLALCDIARHDGVQEIIDTVDAALERGQREERDASRRRSGSDPERVLWAGQRHFRDVLSTPLGVRSAVPAKLVRATS